MGKLESITVGFLWMILILPFVLLSFFTYPNLEDYAESIILGVQNHVEFLYLTYDGRYFSSFLFAAFNPLKYNCFICYKFIPIALILALFFSVRYLIKVILPKSAFSFQLQIAGFLMALFLLNNPSPSYSFYYMISSYVYMVPAILFIVLSAIFLKIIRLELGFTRMWLFFLSVIIIVALAGGNELLFVPLLFLILFFLYVALKTKANLKLEVFLLLIIAMVSLLIAFTSPGTKESLSIDFVAKRDFSFIVSTIVKTVSFSLAKLRNWIFSGFSFFLMVLCGSVVISKYLSTYSKDLPKIKLKYLLAWGIFVVLAEVFFIFPYTWVMGETANESYNQVFILPYLFFCFGLIVAIMMFFLTEIGGKLMVAKFWNNVFLKYFLMAALFILVFSENNKISVAYKDLTSGAARKYAATMSYNILASKNPDANGVVHLCLLNEEPHTIFSGVYFDGVSESFYGQYKMFFNVNHIEFEQCQ
jgi:hypothetical protein